MIAVHPLAGKPAPYHMLISPSKVVADYYTKRAQKPVSFGTSGHRGSSVNGSFNEEHILAVTQAICEYRARKGIVGPLFIGFDTHALSIPAFRTALEVLAANGVYVVVNKDDEYSPTPVISRMIITHNQESRGGQADGIIITPSHNGPQDGGFKYNPLHGGPADTDATGWIEKRANQLRENGNKEVKRIPFEKARTASTTSEVDFGGLYISQLDQVVDMGAIAAARIRIGVDPMGGAAVNYWDRIANEYGLNLTVVNPTVDERFAFMAVDTDGTIRMDCSSPDAMASLIGLRDRHDLSFGNDTDVDRHGIVTPDGLMNPNHYLSVAIWYLLQNRPQWPGNVKVGKTVVSSSMVDRVTASLNHPLVEVPVGFKWFVPGLSDGSLAFGGEESAGASFLRRDGTFWTTDKDGIIMGLLAAEILAKTGMTPSAIYQQLAAQHGPTVYQRDDSPITEAQKRILKAINPSALTARTIAGLKVSNVLLNAPGNGASIGGVKVFLSDPSGNPVGWFAARPSGTEPKFKLYMESFVEPRLIEILRAEAPILLFGTV